jgi:hypothetical protein
VGSDPETENFELIKSGEGGDIGVYRVKVQPRVAPLAITEGYASIALGQRRQSESRRFSIQHSSAEGLVRTLDYVSRVNLGLGV